ncbi:hypothetical protein JX265_006702 [Neoarthrinium moseri]|uniref:Uncharacterized protein n=1 Tax=Neoarthrinium moseri TaxID=1658444 RepID=A0A9Q0ALV6_9PEZI|nr:hypothetical protein JX265_006702 [Neoarthrinium moseri]
MAEAGGECYIRIVVTGWLCTNYGGFRGSTRRDRARDKTFIATSSDVLQITHRRLTEEEDSRQPRRNLRAAAQSCGRHRLRLWRQEFPNETVTPYQSLRAESYILRRTPGDQLRFCTPELLRKRRKPTRGLHASNHGMKGARPPRAHVLIDAESQEGLDGVETVDIYNAQRRRVRDPFIQKLFIARLRPLSQGSPVYTSIARRLSKLVTDDAGMDKSAKEEAAKASPAARADASTQTDEVDGHRLGYAQFCWYGTINNKDRIDSMWSFKNIHGGTHHWVGRQETKDSGYKPFILVICILVMLKIFSWL